MSPAKKMRTSRDGRSLLNIGKKQKESHVSPFFPANDFDFVIFYSVKGCKKIIK